MDDFVKHPAAKQEEQDLLDTALRESDQLLARSLRDAEVRRKRKRLVWFSILGVTVVAVGSLAAEMFSGRFGARISTPVESSLAIVAKSPDTPEKESEEETVRIDTTVCDSPAWLAAIELQNKLPGVRAGKKQMTLLRIVQPDAPPDALFQVSGSKVVPHGKQGGGAFAQIRNGDFIVLEHINSSRRQNGRDPIVIGSFTSPRASLRVTVPSQGTLGLAGDIFLEPCSQDEMGRIVVAIEVETEDNLTIRNFVIGPIAVGGPYGRTIAFTAEHTCDTGLIAPGEYKILLPDFDIVKSRWTIQVSPHSITRLQFSAISQNEIRKTSESESPILNHSSSCLPTLDFETCCSFASLYLLERTLDQY